MPHPLPRRQVLVAVTTGVLAMGAGSLVTGCTGAAPPQPTRQPLPGTDETTRRAAAAREQALAALAASVANRPGAVGAVVALAATAAAAHTAHASALLDGLPVPTGTRPSATIAGAGPTSAGGSGTGTPAATPAATVAATGAVATPAVLRRAQVAAAAEHVAALGPVSGPVARLLASVAGSDDALAAALRGVSG